MENKENCVEWISGEHYCVGSFTEPSKIRKMKKLYEARKSEFKYFVENEDGSICCKYPKKWEKCNPGKSPDAPKREMSPEQKEKLLKALARGRENRSKTR